jgi:CBS domain containing-hemolysin-like protein
MDIFRISLTGLILVFLLAFRFKTDESRFEINRLAEHGAKYKTLARFLDIYPGLLILLRILALVDAILLTIFAAFSWGILGGGAVAFAAILLAWLLGRMLHGVAETLIGKHLAFFNKYFAWAGVLGRLAMVGDEPQISSEHELLHLISKGDFLDDESKILIKNALQFRDKTAISVAVPRSRIAFIHSKDALTPKLLDELFTSGHKIFPIVQGSLDHTVGFLHLDDVLPVEQEEKTLKHVMRKCPPPVNATAPLESALNQMCEYNSTVLLVEKDSKIVGFLALRDVLRALLSPVE